MVMTDDPMSDKKIGDPEQVNLEFRRLVCVLKGQKLCNCVHSVSLHYATK